MRLVLDSFHFFYSVSVTCTTTYVTILHVYVIKIELLDAASDF